MNNEQRIKTNKIAIDEDDVKLFFNNRVNKNLPYLINVNAKISFYKRKLMV